jgi:hypothetical protein
VSSLKFATTLKTLGSEAKNISVNITDHMNKFVYTLEWQDRNGDQSCLMRTCDSVFDYVEWRISGPILGIGARQVSFDDKYKIFVASSTGFYEEVSNSISSNGKHDLVMESMKASSYLGERNRVNESAMKNNVEKISITE